MKVAKFVGNQNTLQTVKGIEVKSESTQTTAQGEVRLSVQNTIVFPDQSRIEVRSDQYPAPMIMVAARMWSETMRM